MSEVSGSDGLRLGSPVVDLPGVHKHRAERFARLGIRTVGDLLRHFPSRYVRVWPEGPIADLPMEQVGSTRGTVVSTRVVGGRGSWGGGGRGGRGGGRFEAVIQDHSGSLRLTWFNATYLRRKVHPGLVVRVQGTTKAYRGEAQMVNPQWEAVCEEGEQEPAGGWRLRPVYPATEDLPSAVIESAVGKALGVTLGPMVDPVPGALIRDHGYLGLADAYRAIHSPSDEDEHRAARRRLAYNELLLLQLGVALKRHHNRSSRTAPALSWSEAIDGHIRARFGFALTGAQDRVIGQIVGDLRGTRPMNRLLQGDVGSGKTVVALYALLLAVVNRRQAALMAPTELLAEQHYLSITSILEGSAVRIGLLTAGQAASGTAGREALLSEIRGGGYDIVVGTQALLGESVRFKDLAVVVIDEQHRFGVMQRAELKRASDKPAGPVGGGADGGQGRLYKEGQAGEAVGQSEAGAGGRGSERQGSPHYLVMTATPIPRTLSLTIFGDLDVSTIDELPPGRTPIRTRVVASDQSDKAYRLLAKRVGAGQQGYVVVPTIDAEGLESAAQLKSVHAHARWLLETHLAGRRVAAIHGRLKRRTREGIMARFRRGDIDVLVATTVIEVGVDVPNATVMVVEHAELFGLSQLHQLRGRVGRGTHVKNSVCVFVADPTTADAEQRVKAIAKTCDGFKIAEQDLLIRGIGEFFGTRQHGAPPLRVAKIPDDLDLLQVARRDAAAIVDRDPRLASAEHGLLKKLLRREYGGAVALIDVG